ncbi:hypothetical protein QQF64_019985 [Cirrhinus molitorella]|uniref:Transposase n=1 Tax=Cirrhinus molitorella TaxID=172907 RepID=A0ABR3LKC4_9TELE
MTDVLSKFMAVPTRDQRAETVAQVLVEEWFYMFGVPGRIHSDQGQRKSRTTPYHPASNGQLTGESPHYLMFGQEPQLPIDFWVPEPTRGTIHSWVKEHRRWLQVAFDGARERLEAAAVLRKRQHDRSVHDLPV